MCGFHNFIDSCSNEANTISFIIIIHDCVAQKEQFDMKRSSYNLVHLFVLWIATLVLKKYVVPFCMSQLYFILIFFLVCRYQYYPFHHQTRKFEDLYLFDVPNAN